MKSAHNHVYTYFRIPAEPRVGTSLAVCFPLKYGLMINYEYGHTGGVCKRLFLCNTKIIISRILSQIFNISILYKVRKYKIYLLHLTIPCYRFISQ